MERLTKKLDGSVVFPKELVGVTVTPDNSAMCALLCRLAAYEDTGLMPEEIKELLYDTTGPLHRKLGEWIDADKDGRLVVLPCKVGQRVFALLNTEKHISECEVKQIGLGNEIGFACIEPIGARGREYGVSLKGFGKTVFLTREEAERALEVRNE